MFLSPESGGVTRDILSLALRAYVKYVQFGYPAELWEG